MLLAQAASDYGYMQVRQRTGVNLNFSFSLLLLLLLLLLFCVCFYHHISGHSEYLPYLRGERFDRIMRAALGGE